MPPYGDPDFQDYLRLFVMIFGPGVVPLLMGVLAGVCVKSKRLGTVCAVSFAGGIGSWLLCFGWYFWSPDVRRAANISRDIEFFWIGLVLITLLAAAGLMAWAVVYSKRTPRRAPGPTDLTSWKRRRA